MIRAVIFVSFLMLGCTAAQAADLSAASAPTFGIVDMNRVMQTSEAARDALGQVDAKRKEYQSEIVSTEEALRAAEQELSKQQAAGQPSPDFETQRKAFEEKVANGQRLVQIHKRTLDQALNAVMSRLRNESVRHVADIAKERGYSAVLTQDAVMIANPQLDITDAVVERMNKHMKRIPIDWAIAAAVDDSPAIKKP